MEKRYSKKRQSIIECLQNTAEHPSAETIYAWLKPLYPDLSLGTVYRNLSELESEGVIVSVGVVEGKARYDYVVEPHVHAICTICGKIIDVSEAEIPHELIEATQKSTGFTVTSSRLQLTGICRECSQKGE